MVRQEFLDLTAPLGLTAQEGRLALKVLPVRKGQRDQMAQVARLDLAGLRDLVGHKGRMDQQDQTPPEDQKGRPELKDQLDHWVLVDH